MVSRLILIVKSVFLYYFDFVYFQRAIVVFMYLFFQYYRHHFRENALKIGTGGSGLRRKGYFCG